MKLNTPSSALNTLFAVTAYDQVFSGFVDRLFKKKSRIGVCREVEVTDEFGRVVQVFYRVIDACDNAQTDESGNFYSIEQVLYKKRRVWLSSCGERLLLEWLYRYNPANVRTGV